MADFWDLGTKKPIFSYDPAHTHLESNQTTQNPFRSTPASILLLVHSNFKGCCSLPLQHVIPPHQAPPSPATSPATSLWWASVLFPLTLSLFLHEFRPCFYFSLPFIFTFQPFSPLLLNMASDGASSKASSRNNRIVQGWSTAILWKKMIPKMLYAIIVQKLLMKPKIRLCG